MEVILNGKITYLRQGQYIKNGEILEVKKPKGLMLEWDFENGIWTEKATPLMLYKFKNREVELLNTPYHTTRMAQEGGTTLTDFYAYMDEKTVYDKQQRKLEQDRQLAYKEALKENPDLTYEEFMSVQPMMLNLVEEPQPSQALKDFMDKYL